VNRWLDVERRLMRMSCPGCGAAGSLQTAVRCELAYGECLYTVRCQRCGLVFDLSTEGARPGPSRPGLDAWSSALACPACSELGPEVEFRCDVPSRSCSYILRCRRCGHEYVAAGPTLSR
jgi:transcription elongation factor Elf1